MPVSVRLQNAKAFAGLLGLCVSLGWAVPVFADEASGPTSLPIPPITSPVLGGPVWLSAWGGLSVTNHFSGGYVGAMVPFNQDLLLDGFVVRGDYAYGSYSYKSTYFGPTKADIDTQNGDLMLGYRKLIGQTWLTGDVGVSFEKHDNADPSAEVRGTKAGVKGLVEIDTPLADNVHFDGSASYASPFRTYFVYGRVGYMPQPQGIQIGPEISTFGDKAYRDERLGAFLSIPSNFGAIDFSAGYVNPLGHGRGSFGGGGYYISMNLGVDFR